MLRAIPLLVFFLTSCGVQNTDSSFQELEATSGKDDLYFVFGGGYQPTGSQAVLERNMELFSEVANKYKVKTAAITKLFAGGNNSEIMDVQVLTRQETPEEGLLNMFLQARGCSNCDYRHNNLPALDGDLKKETVVQYLDRAVKEPSAEDKLNFYYTGHGSHERGRFDQNFMALWRSQLSVQEFTMSLDQMPKETQSQTVMVQCYSGGFALMNYESGVQKLGFSKHNRCGFFSQVANRVAAGCSPDLTQREEYSPYFFAAYAGKNEAGKIVDADYDGNGKITSDEAHAYVIIAEDAIDVPITTSSDLLRREVALEREDLTSFDWTLLKGNLNKIETQIFKSLGQELGVDLLASKDPLRDVGMALSRIIRSDLPQVSMRTQSIQQSLGRKLMALQSWMDDRYPEFQNPANRSMTPSRLLNILQSRPDYPEMISLQKQLSALRDKQLKLERLSAKWERIQYLYETKLREAKLESLGSQADSVTEKYNQLKSCEAKSYF